MGLTRPPVHFTSAAVTLAFWAIYSVSAAQARFIVGSRRRNQLFLGGRGAGKTFALMLKALYLALMNPGLPGAVLGRTGVDLDDTLIPQFEELLAMWEEHEGYSLLASHHKGQKTFVLINGARIIFRPYNQIAKVRGKTYAWICIDEIEYCEGVRPEEAFSTLTFCIRGLKKAKLKCFALATTPDGLRGVVRVFRERVAKGDRRFFVVRSISQDAVDAGFLTQDDVDDFMATCSMRMWRQEGLAEVLKPSNAVFTEFDESRHVRKWKWDPSLPYVIGVDWGEAHAYWCVAQVVDRPAYVNSGRVWMPGTWIVTHERKEEDTTRDRFMHGIVEFIKRAKYKPAWVGGDRAVPEENGRLRKILGTVTVRGCESLKQQRIRRGVEYMRYMLDPVEGHVRLYLSEDLPNDPNPEGRGIRWAMLELGYRKMDDGTLTNEIHKDGINDHPCDALRYGIVTTARIEALHGGDILPCVRGTPLGELDKAA